ncbi:MAG TPA: hypothetical protein VM328_08005 [Fimbriimonadaceae bacterium]|nr:hypothetical protein [Fimbriimonadaceae bacterium]
MPHILLETSADLLENDSIPQILEDLVAVLGRQATIEAQRIKARHALRSNWVMGAGGPKGFAHCACSLIGGRDAELRRAIGQSLFEVMKDCFRDSLAQNEVSLTVEIREMDPDTYFRQG